MALACSHLAVAHRNPLFISSHTNPDFPPAAVTCSFIKPLEDTFPLPFPSHQRFFLLCSPQSLKTERNYAFPLINVLIFTEIIYVSMSFTAVRILCSLGDSFPVWNVWLLVLGVASAMDSQEWNAEFLELVDPGFLLELVCTAGRKGTEKEKSQPWCIPRVTQHLKHHQQWLGVLPSPCWLFKRLLLYKNNLQDLTQAESC